jgi:hypothetical protein
MAELDSLLQLINTRLTFETVTFLRDLVMLAVISPDYMAFLNRIMVDSLTIFKDPQPPRHEGIVAKLIDTDHPDDPNLIFLERTVSAIRPNKEYFSNHPGSDTVVQSIIRTLKDMPSTVLASITTASSSFATTGTPARDLPIPLFDISSSPYHPIIDEPESAQEPDDEPDNKPKRNQLPWFDAATLAGTKALRVLMQFSNAPYRAEDRFIGSGNVEIYVPALHNLRQVKLEASTLPLFDLAVLADCVHNLAPLYSLLEHHCYWFVQILCAVIEKSYPCTTIRSKRYAPVSEDTILIPANDYLPDLEGRTMGILVCRVEEAVVSLVASEFEAYKAVKLEEVHSSLIPNDIH